MIDFVFGFIIGVIFTIFMIFLIGFAYSKGVEDGEGLK